MTGFSSEWLALREPADHRARHAGLCAQMTSYFTTVQPTLGQSAEQPFRVIDLGCGTGSNLRAVAAVLPPYQHWTLVDYDPALLTAALQALTRWADHTHANAAQPGNVTFTKDGKKIEVVCLQEDLAANIERVLSMPVNLVTAAAFFDLVSPDWLVRFCQALTVPLYTVLTYDGTEVWAPPHAADAAMLQAFLAHQATDKGFGLSAGPHATDIMRVALTARGFQVEVGSSPWQLGPSDRGLMRALATGTSGAVAETKTVAQDVCEDWLSARLNAQRCEIGHWDLWATPA